MPRARVRRALTAIEPGADYSAEPTTLLSFTRGEAGAGTHPTIVESGFDAIPGSRRAMAFGSNAEGWSAQAQNLRTDLAAS